MTQIINGKYTQATLTQDALNSSYIQKETLHYCSIRKKSISPPHPPPTPPHTLAKKKYILGLW